MSASGDGGVPPAWMEALAPVSAEVAAITARVAAARAAGKAVAPAEADVFRALALVAPEAVRVVLLGQDPYPVSYTHLTLPTILLV